MKRKILLLSMCVLCVMFIHVGCATNATSPESTNSPSSAEDQTDTDGDGLPDAVEKVLGTNPYAWDTNGNGISDKEDPNPLFTENLIKKDSVTTLPIDVKDVRVEDNVGENGKDAPDHLEMTLKNTGTDTLDNFEIYFTITDKKETDKVEGYYVKLKGLSIKGGEKTTLHFDNKVTESGHYYGNPNGLYGSSENGLTFALQLHADGYKPFDFTIDKAEGAAEVAD